MDLIWILLAAFLGSVLTNVIYFKSTAFGTLKIDNSNPGKDVYRLDIEHLDKVSKKKYIQLKIETGADLSQK